MDKASVRYVQRGGGKHADPAGCPASGRAVRAPPGRRAAQDGRQAQRQRLHHRVNVEVFNRIALLVLLIAGINMLIQVF